MSFAFRRQLEVKKKEMVGKTYESRAETTYKYLRGYVLSTFAVTCSTGCVGASSMSRDLVGHGILFENILLETQLLRSLG